MQTHWGFELFSATIEAHLPPPKKTANFFKTSSYAVLSLEYEKIKPKKPAPGNAKHAPCARKLLRKFPPREFCGRNQPENSAARSRCGVALMGTFAHLELARKGLPAPKFPSGFGEHGGIFPFPRAISQAFARYFPDFGFLIRARDPFAPFLLATPANSTPGLLNDEAHSWEQYSPFHSGGSPRARLAIFTILHSYSRKFSESGLNTGTD